jgi:hypothetical protein
MGIYGTLIKSNQIPNPQEIHCFKWEFCTVFDLNVFDLCNVFLECVSGIQQDMLEYLFVSPDYFIAAVFEWVWAGCCLKFSYVL